MYAIPIPAEPVMCREGVKYFLSCGKAEVSDMNNFRREELRAKQEKLPVRQGVFCDCEESVKSRLRDSANKCESMGCQPDNVIKDNNRYPSTNPHPAGNSRTA